MENIFVTRYITNRDETIWRYIDTVSIRRLTIRIVVQRDISRYDLDICNQGKSLRCLYFLYLTCFTSSLAVTSQTHAKTLKQKHLIVVC